MILSLYKEDSGLIAFGWGEGARGVEVSDGRITLYLGTPAGDGTVPVGSHRIPMEDPDETCGGVTQKHIIWGPLGGDGTDPVGSRRSPIKDPDETCGGVTQKHTLFGDPLLATVRIPSDPVGSRWMIQVKLVEALHGITLYLGTPCLGWYGSRRIPFGSRTINGLWPRPCHILRNK